MYIVHVGIARYKTWHVNGTQRGILFKHRRREICRLWHADDIQKPVLKQNRIIQCTACDAQWVTVSMVVLWSYLLVRSLRNRRHWPMSSALAALYTHLDKHRKKCSFIVYALLTATKPFHILSSFHSKAILLFFIYTVLYALHSFRKIHSIITITSRGK